MRLVNPKFIYRSIIILFLFSCNKDENTTIINSDLDLPDLFKLNLQSNSGENLSSVTMNWNSIDGSVIINGDSITTNGDSIIFNEMHSGEFRDIIFKLSTLDSTYNDTIQIYTRTVSPVTNLTSVIDSVLDINGYWDEDEEYNDGNLDEFDFLDQNGNNICDYTGSMETDDFESNECETFMDGNGIYDLGEDFADSNDGEWNPWEEYNDGNLGVFDFLDIDGNNICDYTGSMETDDFESNECEMFTDSENGLYEPWEEFEDSQNGTYDLWEEFEDVPFERYYRLLSWEPTEESLENFSNYIIYRVDKEDIDLLIEPENCTCQIASLYISTDTHYTDSDSLVSLIPLETDSEDRNFYYRLQVSSGGFIRNSFINDFGFDINSSAYTITLTENDVSKDRDEYIEIKWEQSEATYFYQYEIWRSPDEALTDTSLVVIIPDHDIDHFLDRSTGYGTSWYYSVATVDINGNKIFSNFIRGWKKP